ncbi:hemicentin-1-like isoform X2 [Ptychodera flava]|uniref:hemicentin-1-like isoform X2 n=1 Tax=Ptychodera flava TaxID=63121 RepID=UPI00396A606C
MNSGSLRITSVKRDHSGQYSCIVSNTAGSAQRDILLHVHEPPVIRRGTPDEISKHEGDRVVLPCPVSGFPRPDITWYKDGQELGFHPAITQDESGTLFISVAEAEDSGIYMCLATNNAGNSTHSITVKILVGTVIAAGPTEISVPIGQPVTLPCEVSGDPIPTVTWDKERSLLVIDGKSVQQAQSGSLYISSVRETDAGIYVCTAANVVHVDTRIIKLNVLVGPTIIPGITGREISVTVDDETILPCKAEGIPVPDILWLKDGRQLTGYEYGMEIRADGSLRIFSGVPSDSGTYTCIARNRLGNVTIEYELRVNVPPFINGNGYIEITSILGNPVILPCENSGDPTPQITWEKNSEPLLINGQIRRILDTGSLQIDSTRETDSGEYACIAYNIAGSATKIIILTVQNPPRIAKDIPLNITARVNTEATLYCHASGIPRPTIVWLKNGAPVRLYGDDVSQREDGSLHIKSAQPVDSGVYTCMASNKAGNTTVNIDFTVYVAPTIPGSSFPHNETAVTDTSLTLKCPVDENAVPVPSIYWLKDGNRIGRNQHGILIMSGGRLLQIPSVQITDAGRYTCIAVNAAGNGTKIYDVIVQVPPSIDDSELPIDIVKIEGTTLTLDCDSTAIPPPTLTWLKNGAPITPNDRGIRITGRGRHLHIANVEDFHRGQYTCVSSNIVGNSTKIYTLAVQTAPDIDGADFPNLVEVLQNWPVDLECPADANPPPRITWYKEGRRLSPREHGMRIMRRNTLLQIYSAQVFDSGNYRCIATNIAGNNSKTFDVKVIVPPTIREDPHFVNVPVGTDVTLPCSVQGIPAPKLTWHKDGTRLSRNSGGYLIADSGSLTISSASVADSGEYTCLASNSGGNATRTVTLEIQIPPSIQNISPKVKANVFETVTLRCPVTGNPPPSIHWYKGASALTGNGDSLIIKRAELSDAGAYTCYARSTAGFDSAMIHVTIFERPTIKESFQQYVVIEDQLVTMKCTAEGTPKPTIRWQREHIDISENDVRYRVLPNGYLHIPFARREDSGMFKCIAENDGGSAEQLMNLYVQVPPTIKKSKVEFSVLIYDNIGLPCEAEGIPKPTISWAKDGNSLDSVPGYIVTPEGTLYIYRTRERDSGDYVCTAINDAGRESSKMTLTVQVPPKFIETPTDYELEINEKIDLVCEATGVPTPEITWSLNGKPRPGATGGNGRSILTIEHARKEDEGTYLCTATNDVGQERFVAAVRIKVPPNVIELRQDRTIKEAASVTFHCNVTGDPKPYIIWQKDGREVEESNRIYKHRNGSLSIFGALNSDTGNYTCSAINDLGRADRIVGELSVTSRPHITTGEPQNKIVDLGQPVLINCVADGKPKPTIEWWTQGAMIQESERIQILANNSLLIVAARQEDNRLYNCKAVNTLGSDDTQTTVIVRVHGDWSEWDKWGACSVTCGQGLQTRSRTCDNPMPANGGRLCRGNHNEDKVCNHGACPIHGQWGDWMPWEECTKTCGQGTRSRTRLCDNPTPQFGGRACQGSAFDQQICNIKPCPVDGNWGAWGPWQECSESCGEGTQIRSRQCNNPAPRDGGQDCPQSDTQSRMCKVQLCSVDGKWSSWSSWSMCSKSCGTGERQRTRTCTEPAPLHNGRYCEGVDYNVDFCNTDGCPVHGGWSEWEEWGECSSSCNGGQQKRHRACINPRPSNGGRRCSGSDLEMKVCGLQQCPIDGGWSEWGDWTQCSKSCGDGIMTRYRSCSNPIPRSGGRPCSGDESQQSRCYSDPCPDGPAAAVGNIAGEINGVTFGVASLLANISSYGSENHVHAKINNIPNSVGHWMRKLVSLLTPIYWTSAYEIGQAVNGYTLTRGYFVRQTQVEFATGEVLRMDHQVSGLDENGQLIIDVIINGDVPRIPASVDIALKPYTEDYVQTGPGEIYAYSTRMFTTNGRPMPYAWNHTIKYDIERGKMPYLVEKLYATGLGVEYDPYKEVLEYEIVTSIARGDPSNQCPRGFNMDPSGRFCTDEDECSGQSVCSHKCHNKAGGYTCSCPDGMVLGMDGHSCQDVDECATNNGGCSAWQECINTEGSFRCEAKCSIGYNRAKSGTACIDINECIALPRLCDHLCMNTIGSYRCRCRNGYRLSDQQGTCRDVNECEYRNPCPRGMGCVNMPGSFRCENTCERGYKVASNGSCVDIDECMTRQHRCSYNQVCKNTPGGYECSCPRGYRSDGMGRVCQDINECRQNPSICSYECRNLPGTYECICPPGQKRLGNRKGCAKLVWDQDGLQQVFSTRGCDQGMQMINGRCEDINECDNPSTCQHECINTEGSYQCSCPPGYTVDKSEPRRCQDVDECLEQNIDCGLNRMCFNKLGSYECIDTPCPPGYTRKTSDGDCVRDCPYSSPSVCSNNFKDILRYETLALPKGVSSHNDLVRLVTYTQDGSVHPRSNYRIIENISGVPFNIRRENDKGILYTLAPLREPKTYQIKVQATSLTQNLSQIEFQTTFVIFISVSHYPY